MSNQHEVEWRMRLRVPFMLIAVLGIASCETQTHAGPPLVKKQSWETRFNKGDAGGVARLYAQNAELVVSGSAPIRGRDAIRAAISKMVQSGVKVHIDATRSAVAGHLAYFFGSYQVFLHEKLVERGTYLELWRRYGGHWLIDLDVNATGTSIAAVSRR